MMKINTIGQMKEEWKNITKSRTLKVKAEVRIKAKRAPNPTNLSHSFQNRAKINRVIGILWEDRIFWNKGRELASRLAAIRKKVSPNQYRLKNLMVNLFHTRNRKLIKWKGIKFKKYIIKKFNKRKQSSVIRNSLDSALVDWLV